MGSRVPHPSAVIVVARRARSFAPRSASLPIAAAAVLLAASLSGCLMGPPPPPPPPNLSLTAAGAAWLFTDPNTLQHSAVGAHFLVVNISLGNPGSTFFDFRDASVSWPDHTSANATSLRLTVAPLSHVSANLSFEIGGTRAPTLLTVRGEGGVTVSTTLPTPLPPPPDELVFENVTASRADRYIFGGLPPAGETALWVRLTLVNRWQGTIHPGFADFSVTGPSSSKFSTDPLNAFFPVSLAPGARALVNFSVSVPSGWTPAFVQYQSTGGPWAQAPLNLTPGVLRYFDVAANITGAAWVKPSTSEPTELHLRLLVNNSGVGIFAPSGYTVTWDNGSTTSFFYSYSWRPSESYEALFVLHPDRLAVPVNLTIEALYPSWYITLPIPPPSPVPPAFEYLNMSSFWSEYDADSQPSGPGETFLNAWFEVRNLGTAPLTTGQYNFEAVNATGSRLPAHSSFFSNSVAPGAQAEVLLTFAVPLGWQAASLHYIGYDFPWASTPIPAPNQTWPVTRINMTVTSADWRFEGPSGDHTPRGSYYLWLNLTLTHLGNATITPRPFDFAVDNRVRYEFYGGTAAWTNFTLATGESTNITLAFKVPGLLPLSRVVLYYLAFSPGAEAPLPVPAAAAPEAAFANLTAAWSTADLNNTSALAGRHFLWVTFNITNAWGANLGLLAPLFTVWATDGSNFTALEKSGPDSLAPAAESEVTLVFDVPLGWTPAQLNYDMPSGPWDGSPVPTPS